MKAENPSARVKLLLREAAPAWTAIVALTVLAWIVTLDQVRAMGNGAGTMGMSFVAFVAMWTAMMAAMMFPSMAPVAILWTRSIVRRSSSAVASYRIALFVTGYLLAWAFAGVLAFFGLALFEQVLVLAGNHAGWLGAAIFVTAGVYQLTSFKDVCLRHCRSPMSLLVHYTSFRGPAIDLRVGFHHGLYCVACCWGLMLILVAVGVMNIPGNGSANHCHFCRETFASRPSHSAAHRYFFLRCSSRGGDFSQAFPRSELMLPGVSRGMWLQNPTNG